MGDSTAGEEHIAQGTEDGAGRPARATPHSGRSIYSVYQPIVSLDTGRTVAYEALARGSDGTTPDWLFADARRHGRLADLDWMCRGAACSGALSSGLPPDIALFVNVEPASARVPCPPVLTPVMTAAAQRLQLVAEVAERLTTADPVGLLAAGAAHRRAGSRIAFDGVGTVPGAQSMMSLLRPDMIKLDRALIQGRCTSADLSVVDAVVAEAQRTGAVIIAEGIETPEHRAVARSMGATLAQGWLFGHPGPLPERFEPSELELPRTGQRADGGDTPFDVVLRHRPAISRVDRHLLSSVSRQFEDRGVYGPDATVVLSTFQNGRYFTGATRQRYNELASKGVLTAVFAVDLPEDQEPSLRGCGLAADDPLAQDWTVIVIGNHFAGGLFARDADPGHRGDEQDRRFDLMVTFDRDLVLAAAAPLLRRLMPPTDAQALDDAAPDDTAPGNASTAANPPNP